MSYWADNDPRRLAIRNRGAQNQAQVIQQLTRLRQLRQQASLIPSRLSGATMTDAQLANIDDFNRVNLVLNEILARVQALIADPSKTSDDYVDLTEQEAEVLYNGTYSRPSFWTTLPWATPADVASVTWSTLSGKPSFATVATSGSYNDLTDKPVLTTGPAGPKGDKGDTGNTGPAGTNGAQGPSGVVTVNSPLTNSGTNTAANLSVSSASASAAGTMSAADFVKLSKLSPRAYIATASASKSGANTTEASIVPAGIGTLVVPSAVFDTTGYSFRFSASGTYTNVLTGVVTIRIKLGSQITLSAAVSFPILSSKTWVAQGMGTVRAGRVLYSVGNIEYDNGSTTDGAVFAVSNITVAAGDQTAAMTAQWNLVLGGASITVDQLNLDIIPAP